METEKCSGRLCLHAKIHNPRSSLSLRKVVMCRIENGKNNEFNGPYVCLAAHLQYHPGSTRTSLNQNIGKCLPLTEIVFYVKFFNEIINCSVISLVSRSHINIPKLHIIRLFLNDGNTNLINVDPILLAFSTQKKEISM